MRADVRPLLDVLAGPVLRRPDVADEVAGTYGRCLPAGDGAWALALEAIHFEDPIEHAEDDYVEWTGRAAARALFVGRDGRVRSFAPWALSFVSEAPSDAFGWGFDRVTIEAVADLDRDGSHEAYVMVDTPRERRRWVLARRDDAIVEIELPRARDIVEVRDVDGDGRPDLIAADDLSIDVSCSGEARRPTWTGLRRPILAGADGTFSDRDERAVAEVAATCRDVPAAPLVPPDCETNDVVVRVACARYRGETADAVEARLRREAPAAEHLCRDCLYLETLLHLAREQPLFTIPREG